MNFINAVDSLFAGRSIVAAAATASGTDAAGAMCAPNATGTSPLMLIVMYAVIFGLCYLILIRPQKKRRQQEEELRKSVEIGDEITTIGGICGRIVSIKEDNTIVIETGADRCKLKMKNWAISTNESAKARQAEAAPEKKGFLSGLFGKKAAKNEGSED